MNIEIDDFLARWLPELLLTILITIVSLNAYGIPFLAYPYEQSNPWPYAYNTIQDQIIKTGSFVVKTPQFGIMGRSDHTWFLIHHLTYVSLKSLTDLPYETIERVLSVILSIVFFLSFYIFAREAFGRKAGLTCSIFFLLVPRTHNYLVTVNGEFLSWLVLFPALTLFIHGRKNRSRQNLIISAILGAFLPLSNLLSFGLYLLIAWLYLLAEFLSSGNIIEKVKVAILIVLPFFAIALPPLIATGDITPGSSSTIGSLFASRTSEEIYFENVYYDSYCDYWKVFASESPILVGFKYFSVDYLFIYFVACFYLLPAAAGVFVSLKNWRKPALLFSSLWLFSLSLLTIVLFSPASGPTIKAFGIRLLLYFGWAVAIVSGLGFYEIAKAVMGRAHFADRCFAISTKKQMISVSIVTSLLLALIFSGIAVSAQSAAYANSYPALYAKEFKDALEWIRMNTPSDAIIVCNDWTDGIFWLKSQRMSLTEGSKGSAVYLTYEEIVRRLNDAREILTSNNLTKTISLMNEHHARYIVVWTRVSGYYVCPPEEVNTAKFEFFGKFKKVFDEEHVYDIPHDGSFQRFRSYARIYHLVDNSTSFIEMVGANIGSRVGYTNGTFMLSYKLANLVPSMSLDNYTEANLCVYMKRLGDPNPENYNITINKYNLTIDVADVAQEWELKSFRIPITELSSLISITFPIVSDWDSSNQILIGTTEVPGPQLTYYSFDGNTWTEWKKVNLYAFIELVCAGGT